MNTDLIKEANAYLYAGLELDKDGINDIIQRLTTALKAQEWNPIETSPKDGTDILAAR